MAMSKRCAETLLDLVEVKLSCIEVYDREDKREVALLEAARKELLVLAGRESAAKILAMNGKRVGAAAC